MRASAPKEVGMTPAGARLKHELGRSSEVAVSKSRKPSPLVTVAARPRSPELSRAWTVLKHAHDSASAMLAAFDSPSGGGRARGAPTDEEQDLLRAMLIFAGAGLDSSLKHALAEALPAALERSEAARGAFRTFAERQLRGLRDGQDSVKFLARILTGSSPAAQLRYEYIDSLVSNSLQSTEELARVTSAFGLERSQVKPSIDSAKPVFRVRNQILHELDINFDHATRNRESRSRPMMIQHVNVLLSIAGSILEAVDKLLRLPGNPTIWIEHPGPGFGRVRADYLA